MTVKIDQSFVNAYIDADIGLSIAHENTGFEPAAGTEYVELLNMPNDITPADLTSTNETDGLFRIILRWPVNDGAIQAKLKADEIISAFSIGSTVCYESQCARVTKTERHKGYAENVWYKIILSVSYYANIKRI